jgi:hypothetical protein
MKTVHLAAQLLEVIAGWNQQVLIRRRITLASQRTPSAAPQSSAIRARSVTGMPLRPAPRGRRSLSSAIIGGTTWASV